MEQEAHSKDSGEESEKPADHSLPDTPIVEAAIEGEQEQEATRPTNTEQPAMQKIPRSPSTWADWFQVGIQSILVLGALYALCIYEGQLVEMKRSNDLGKITAEIAVKAQRNSEDAVRLSRLDQRAWVATTKFSGTPELGKPLGVAVGIKNSGKTVAREVDVTTVWAINDIGSEPNFAYVEADPDPARREHTNLLLPPNGEYKTTMRVLFGQTITQDRLDKILTEQQLVFIYGKITYKDVFDCTHWTTFCVRYSPLGTSEGYIVYKTYNDTDTNPCP